MSLLIIVMAEPESKSPYILKSVVILMLTNGRGSSEGFELKIVATLYELKKFRIVASQLFQSELACRGVQQFSFTSFLEWNQQDLQQKHKFRDF